MALALPLAAGGFASCQPRAPASPTVGKIVDAARAALNPPQQPASLTTSASRVHGGEHSDPRDDCHLNARIHIGPGFEGTFWVARSGMRSSAML